MDVANEATQDRDSGSLVIGIARRVGETLRDSAVFSAPDIAELERAAVGVGARSSEAIVRYVFARQGLMTFAYPDLGVLCRGRSQRLAIHPIGEVALAARWRMLGATSRVLGWMRRIQRRRCRRVGLPDALDLLVVCAEAGLSLDERWCGRRARDEAVQPGGREEFAILRRS